jgi:hypothetical protein
VDELFQLEDVVEVDKSNIVMLVSGGPGSEHTLLVHACAEHASALNTRVALPVKPTIVQV